MTRSIHAAAIIAVVILFFCLSMLAQAAVPSSLNYQGYLTDSDGSAVDGDVVVTFSIYTIDPGGTPIWTDTELVTIDQGLFSVELGAGIAFPPGLFETPLWLGVTVDGDVEMVPRRPLTTVGFAFQADDALSLQGQTPAAFDQTAHVANMANPHGVDAAQTGAATPASVTADIAAHTVLSAAHHAQYTNTAAVAAVLAADGPGSGLDADTVDGIHGISITTLQAQIAALETLVGQLETRLQAVEGNSVLDLDGILTQPDAQTALFTAVNVQVVNGTGVTNGALNGLGNLIVGYNAPRASGSDKSGSHNLIVGDNHNFTSYGGLVSGYENTVSGVSASVSGGAGNTASGSNASVMGGRYNLASGNWSSVSGGGYEDTTWSNHAYADYSSILGGTRNTTGDPDGGDRFPGANSTISGGGSGQVTGISGSISGGRYNVASGYYASVSGGNHNTASGSYASVTGGRNNVASGSWSSVSGGGLDLVEYGNHAYADYSSILGGARNTTGDPDGGDPVVGTASTVSGGDTGDVIGYAASISGGRFNAASGSYASVSGGASNTAGETFSSVSGGGFNTASGEYSSVTGGESNIASGEKASVTAGRKNVASGNWSSVSGGGLDTTETANHAYANYSSITGGAANTTGDMSGSPSLGAGSSVSGGYGSTAFGIYASISGGTTNYAGGEYSAVSGGHNNTASNTAAVISGGSNNVAEGAYSTVSGGLAKQVTGPFDWRAGGLFQDD